MAADNSVHFVGNLVRDVELKFIPSGTAVTTSTVAINKSVRVGDKRENKPVYVDVTFWGRSAETLAEYAGKGSKVLVEGELDMDQWESEQGKRTKLKVVCNSFKLLDRKNSSENFTEKKVDSPKVDLQDEYVDDGEVPF